MADSYRYKLIKTFWYTARETGLCNELANDFVSANFPGKSLSKLTIDELEVCVKELIKTSRLDIRMPWKTVKKKNQQQHTAIKGTSEHFQPASVRQLQKIDRLAEQIGLHEGHILKLAKKFGHIIGPFSVQITQKLIECMKDMIRRGWKPDDKEAEEIPENVTWN